MKAMFVSLLLIWFAQIAKAGTIYDCQLGEWSGMIEIDDANATAQLKTDLGDFICGVNSVNKSFSLLCRPGEENFFFNALLDSNTGELQVASFDRDTGKKLSQWFKVVHCQLRRSNPLLRDF